MLMTLSSSLLHDVEGICVVINKFEFCQRDKFANGNKGKGVYIT